MNHAERVAARKFKLLGRAQSARSEGQSKLDRADAIARFIPMGQPILVGHHSEKRHRKDLSRIQSGTTKGFELIKHADRLERQAENVGRAISSDDSDAVELLTAKVATMEAAIARIKAYNASCRKIKGAVGDLSLLDESQKLSLQSCLRFQSYACKNGAFPAYALSNDNANVRRIRQRIEDLKRKAVAPKMETLVGDGFTIEEDVEDNRIVIRFDAKPERAMLDALRGAGFKWSPTRGAHVRMRSPGAIYHAKRVLGGCL